MSSALTSTYNSTDGTWRVHRVDALIVKAAMRRATFNSIWAGVLLTLVLALVLLSTAQQRRGVIFYIQCMAFPLALVYNALCIVYAFCEQENIFVMPGQTSITNKQVHLQVATLSLEHWIPLLSDSALLFKFASFYPDRIYSRIARALRLGPLVLLMLPRLVMTCIFTHAVVGVYLQRERTVGYAPALYSTNQVHLLMVSGTAEFALQAPYCLYAATVLLYKTLDLRRSTSQHRGSGVYRRLRFFMETIFMTFLPPVAFSIACAIQLNCPTTGYCAFREISGTNLNSSVAFSLLATSWSTIRSRRTTREQVPSTANEPGGEELNLAANAFSSSERKPHSWTSVETEKMYIQPPYLPTISLRDTQSCLDVGRQVNGSRGASHDVALRDFGSTSP